MGDAKIYGSTNATNPLRCMDNSRNNLGYTSTISNRNGHANGGGAVYYAAMMSLYDQNAKVMTIDTRPVDETKQLYSIPGFCTRMKCTNATDNLFWSRNIEFVQGDPLSTFVRSKVNRAVRCHRYGIPTAWIFACFE